MDFFARLDALDASCTHEDKIESLFLELESRPQPILDHLGLGCVEEVYRAVVCHRPLSDRVLARLIGTVGAFDHSLPHLDISLAALEHPSAGLRASTRFVCEYAHQIVGGDVPAGRLSTLERRVAKLRSKYLLASAEVTWVLDHLVDVPPDVLEVFEALVGDASKRDLLFDGVGTLRSALVSAQAL